MRKTAFILLLLLACPALAQQKLVFSMPDDEVDNVSLRILERAYSKLGYVVEGEPLPAARALTESQSGNTDGEVNRIAAIEPQLHSLIRIKTPVNAIEGVAFTCPDAPPVFGWASIRTRKIGVRSGIRFVEMATRGMPHVTKMPDYDTLFDMLARGRLDVVIASRQVGFAQRKRSSATCSKAHEPPLETLELYHYLHRRHKDLAPEITRVLSDMHASGEYETLHKFATKEFRTQ